MDLMWTTGPQGGVSSLIPSFRADDSEPSQTDGGGGLCGREQNRGVSQGALRRALGPHTLFLTVLDRSVLVSALSQKPVLPQHLRSYGFYYATCPQLTKAE